MRKGRQRSFDGPAFIEFFREKRWFQHKEARINTVSAVDYLDIGQDFRIGFFEVSFEDHAPELYLIPTRKRDSQLDVVSDDGFLRALFGAVCSGSKLGTKNGCVSFQKTGDFNPDLEHVSFEMLPAGSSNTLVICKRDIPICILKMLRRLLPGKNAEAETGEFLSQKTDFRNIPRIRATVSYRHNNGLKYHVATLFDFVQNQGSGWDWTLARLAKLIDQFVEVDVAPDEDSIGLAMADYNKMIYGLGRTLASLHMALASGTDGEFDMRTIADADIAAWRENLLNQANRTFSLMRRCSASADDLILVLFKEKFVIECLDKSPEVFKKLAWRIRQHADFHLGQVLVNHDTFYIIDFEGEPLKPYTERAAHYPALKDVAGMMRSFNYASFAAYYGCRGRYEVASVLERIKQICRHFEVMAARSFLDGYYQHLKEADARFLPLGEPGTLKKLLAILTLEKALYEVEYEINNRPDWLPIPLGGILNCMGDLS